MSRLTNKFSLFDFCKKQAGKMEIYGEETLDEEGEIIPFIEQAALITHYLLYHDLKFETASASRHELASITKGLTGNQYFTLNLQLRFIQ